MHSVPAQARVDQGLNWGFGVNQEERGDWFKRAVAHDPDDADVPEATEQLGVNSTAR